MHCTGSSATRIVAAPESVDNCGYDGASAARVEAVPESDTTAQGDADSTAVVTTAPGSMRTNDAVAATAVELGRCGQADDSRSRGKGSVSAPPKGSTLERAHSVRGNTAEGLSPGPGS